MRKVRFKKLRLWAAYPFAGIYLVLVYRNGLDFNFGIGFIILGLLIRFWAAGFILKIRELTTAGPYAFMRNPLYLGNFLIGMGFCLFVKNIILFSIFVFLFFILYIGTIRDEEILLTDLFGQEYLNYKKSVPRFLPSFKKYKSSHSPAYSLRQAHCNGEFIRIFVTGILLAALCFFQYFFKEKIIDKNAIFWFGFMFASLVGLLGLNIVHRKQCLGEENTKK